MPPTWDTRVSRTLMLLWLLLIMNMRWNMWFLPLFFNVFLLDWLSSLPNLQSPLLCVKYLPHNDIFLFTFQTHKFFFLSQLKSPLVFQFMVNPHQYVSRKDEGDKFIVFEKGDLVFVFNFHWTNSYTDYRVGCMVPGKYKVSFFPLFYCLNRWFHGSFLTKNLICFCRLCWILTWRNLEDGTDWITMPPFTPR